MTASTGDELAVVVTRADGTVCQIGPIFYRHVAEQIARGLQGEAYSTTGAAEAGIVIAPFDVVATSLPLLQCEAESLLAVMDDPVQGSDAPFPDLCSRVVAQHGDRGREAFGAACILMDFYEAQVEKERELDARRAKVDGVFDRELRKMAREFGLADPALDACARTVRSLADAWAAERAAIGGED